jgi:hypothetical protein
MSISKPALSVIWGSDASGNLLDPGGVKNTGMPAGAKSIPRRWMNWILNKTDSAGRYLLGRGVPDWDVGETYSIDDRVQYNGSTYACTHPPLAHQTPADASYWQRWGFTALEFEGKFSDMLSAAFGGLFSTAFEAAFGAKVAITDVRSLVTVDPLVSNGVAKAVAIGNLRIMLLTFTGNTDLTSFPITFADAIGWARSGHIFPFVRGSGQGGAPTYTTIANGSMGVVNVGYLGGIGGLGSTWQIDMVIFNTVA